MARRLALLFTLAAVVFCGVMVWQLYQTKQAMENGAMERELEEAMDLVDLPETLGDQVLRTVGLEWAGIEEAPEPWGIEEGGIEGLREDPLGEEEAREALHPSSKLRRAFLARLIPGLEAPGDGTLLNQEPDLQHQIGVSKRMAADMLSLLVLGRAEEALEIYRTGQRHARILARGFRAHPQLIATLVAVAQAQVLDGAAARGLELGLWTGGTREALEASVRDSLVEPWSLGPAMEAEFDKIAKVIEIVDRRLGPAGWAAALYWGDGQRQLEEIRAAWKAGEPPPDWLGEGKCHVLISVAMPSWNSPQEALAAAREARRGLLRRLEEGGGER